MTWVLVFASLRHAPSDIYEKSAAKKGFMKLLFFLSEFLLSLLCDVRYATEEQNLGQMFSAIVRWGKLWRRPTVQRCSMRDCCGDVRGAVSNVAGKGGRRCGGGGFCECPCCLFH